MLDQQRLEAALDRDGDPLDLLRLALEPAADPVADPADTGLQGPQQLTGADELLPAGEDLAAQQAAVGGRLGDVAPRLVVGAVHVVAAAVAVISTWAAWAVATSLGPPARPTGRPRRGSAGRRPRGRSRRRRAARARCGSRATSRRPAAARPRRRAAPSTVNSGERSRPRSREHLLQVRGDLVAGAGRDPVEHDRDRGAALGGRAQEVPGHLVGVAGGRGDEEPEVGGGQQLGGERAVADLDRVDVRGVEDRQARRARSRPARAGATGVAGGRRGAREVGQDAGVVEPAGVGRVEAPAPATGSSGAARRAR